MIGVRNDVCKYIDNLNTTPASNLGLSNVGPTSEMSSRRRANIVPTYITSGIKFDMQIFSIRNATDNYELRYS